MAGNTHEKQLIDLKDTISRLNKTIESLQKSIDAGQERERVLQEQIDYLTKKLFGTSREKRGTDGQIGLFDEAEQEADPSAPEPPPVEVRSHTRKPKKTSADKFSALPVKDVVMEIPEELLVCPNCGSELELIGKEFIRQEVQFIPAQMRLVRYYSPTYACRDCCSGGSDRGYFLKADVPAPLMKHSPASPSSVAWAMYQKYANAMPLYRQEKDWRQYGAEITRATLANWIIYCAEHYLKPLHEYFRRELLKRKFLMADETRVQVLKEPGRSTETDSFMWLFRSGEDGLPPILLYHYTETRARYNAEEFLRGFSGYLETDGYQGYENLPGVRRCCCYAHVRRYFYDAIPKGKADDMSHPAVQGVSYCDKLFHYERVSREKGHSSEERHAFRLEKEKPVVDAFFRWLDEQKPVKNSRLDKAVTYAKNRKPYLTTYLEDGRCSLSNNLSENAIRPFTVGRKNWLFSDTPKGAEASAVCYTMVEMAKTHGLNIFQYLNYLLVNRPTEETPDRVLEKLVPWNPDVRKACCGSQNSSQ